MTSTEFIAMLQGSPEAFKGVVEDEKLYRLRAESGAWAFGEEVIDSTMSICSADTEWREQISICLENNPSLYATWYKIPNQEESFVIGVNSGLVAALQLIAHDVMDFRQDDPKQPLEFTPQMLKNGVEQVSSRLGAFLQLGFPFGLTSDSNILPRSKDLVKAIVADALRFAVLHEVAHLLLRHDRHHLLRNQLTDLQIATFSIGQEHQADKLALRLHAAIRQTPSLRYPGMEFAGPALLFGVLSVFERYTRYQEAFDTPHAHPPAYERLYRLRVAMSQGQGDFFWAHSVRGGLRLAKLDLSASPEAVAFSDAVSASLLAVLEGVEEEGSPSPINDLFNKFASCEIHETEIDSFTNEIMRWMFLGSPERVLVHLGEAYRAASFDLGNAAAPEDETFLRNALHLTECAIRRARKIESLSVRRAIRRYDAIVSAA